MLLRQDMLPSHLRMAVPPHRPEASPRFRRIIVCLDFSAECDDALQSLAAVAAGTDVMLELVYIIDPFTEAFVQGTALPNQRFGQPIAYAQPRRFLLSVLFDF